MSDIGVARRLERVHRQFVLAESGLLDNERAPPPQEPSQSMRPRNRAA